MLANRTVLGHVISRVQQVSGIDEVIVATTSHPADDLIEPEASRYGATVFRGSEADVLSRYFLAASQAKSDVVIRITSDCPLLDPEIVSLMLTKFVGSASSGSSLDYMSNGLRRTFPRGLDAEIFLMDSLARAHREAKLPYEREHVTPYIYEHPDEFRIFSYEGRVNLSHYRWTLDTEQDFLMLTQVFEALRPLASPSTADVLAYLGDHPEVAQINADVQQKALGQ
jgi:spore coat polysaccharide biosynthesis protein SpsF